MTASANPSLPSGDLGDLADKLKRDHAQIEAFRQSLSTKVAHLVWKGGHADTFRQQAETDLSQLKTLLDDLVQLQTRLTKLDATVTQQKKLIGQAEQEVLAKLNGQPLPANVAQQLDLQPGYLPPQGSPQWITAAKDLGLQVKA